MGFFSSKGSSDSGRTSAEGGNGHVRDTRNEHSHAAIVTPNLGAVRNLQSGTSGYQGKHRA